MEQSFLSKFFSLIALFVALIVAALAVLMYIRDYRTKPDINDWAVLDGELRNNVNKETDIIAVVPFWAERGLEFFGDLSPHFVHDISTWDLDSVKRVHLVWVFAKDKELFERLEKDFEPRQEKKIGKITYDLLERRGEPAKVVYDFYERFTESAGYVIDAKGERQECRKRSDEGLQCGEKRWMEIERRWAQVNNDPHRCIWAHPQSEKAVYVSWENIPNGQRLTVHAGLTSQAVRKGGAPVKIDVEIDELEMGGMEIPNEDGWFRLDIGVPGTPSEQSHRVVFKITAPHDGMRHFCFDALLRNYPLK
ncbi:MAG: hypothetical protein Kow0090_11560 [Myxococcota bacterium]